MYGKTIFSKLSQCSKHDSDNLEIPAPTEIFVRLSQSYKTPFPIVVTELGITIFSNPSQFLNASFPSSLTVFGITISVNDVQPLKALSFIDSRQSLHSTFFKELQPSNACGHIVVTVFGS